MAAARRVPSRARAPSKANPAAVGSFEIGPAERSEHRQPGHPGGPGEQLDQEDEQVGSRGEDPSTVTAIPLRSQATTMAATAPNAAPSNPGAARLFRLPFAQYAVEVGCAAN